MLITYSQLATYKLVSPRRNEICLPFTTTHNTKMMISTTTTTASLLILLMLLSFTDAATDNNQVADFLKCIYSNSSSLATAAENVVFSSTDDDTTSFTSVLHSSIRNKRFETTATPMPLVVVRPTDFSHVAPVVVCAKTHGLHLRVRSGGHDYEGLSYVSPRPSVLLDLLVLSDVTVDAAHKTAWIQSGATVGQVYFSVELASSTLAFPAGLSPTVGIGGQLSGGGIGTLLRYAGVAADHVTDVVVVDSEGRVRDRKSLGEDVFWAVRGGGGNTFGVVLAWKVDLVPVPEIFTAGIVSTNMEQLGEPWLVKWQQVAATLPDKMFVQVVIYKPRNGTMTSSLTVTVKILYVGPAHEAISVLHDSSPELGVFGPYLVEMPWVKTVLYFADFGVDESPEVLVGRVPLSPRKYFKAKSDYVTQAIPVTVLQGLWKQMLQDKYIEEASLILTPYGGQMANISESSNPFPHRGGNLFEIQYLVLWTGDGEEEGDRHVRWIRELYAYMRKYVSSNPRCAYVNYRDLDIGSNNLHGITIYKQSKVWGEKYFKKNFDKLVRIKTSFDPTNFFNNEQSVPSLSPLAGQNQHTRKNRAPERHPSACFSALLLCFLLL